MTFLEWKPEYSLGQRDIDFEHRMMIDLINDCHARLADARDPEAIERFLGEIHAGIAAHFALEEQIMRKAAYPEYEAHKEDHEKLLDEIRDLMDSFAADPEAGAQLLKARLGGWFGHHFATFDARLHDRLPRSSTGEHGS